MRKTFIQAPVFAGNKLRLRIKIQAGTNEFLGESRGGTSAFLWKTFIVYYYHMFIQFVLYLSMRWPAFTFCPNKRFLSCVCVCVCFFFFSDELDSYSSKNLLVD